MFNSKKLHGKTVLITGCNRGIGFEIMNLFACNGANIVACTRKETPVFLETIKLLEHRHEVTIIPLFFDLANEESIKQSMRELSKQKIAIDVLVNNAGVAFGELMQMTSMEKMRNIFQINFFSQVLITQYVVKMMSKTQKGCIINMGSAVGLDSFPGYTAYGSSKSAFMHFSKICSKELANNNIRVNAIAPGLTDTDMLGQMNQKAMEEMVSRTSFNRFGMPLEIAQLALFLASDESTYINGQIIRIDGGM